MKDILDKYLEDISKLGQVFGLENINSLLDRLDRPDLSYGIVHIGGTNGKGSTANYIYNILIEEGYRVGIFTSPNLNKYNVRIEETKKEIGEEDFYRLGKKLMDICIEDKINITIFEFLTALGLTYFREREIDILILEVGMGGRLDATNAIKESLVSVITNIGMDHGKFLGNSLEEIAREKSKIIKENSNLVLYDNGDLNEIFMSEGKRKNCDIRILDPSKIKVRDVKLGSMIFSYGEYVDLEAKMTGFDQMKNIGLSIELIGVLRKYMEIKDSSIYKGIKNTRVSYVYEILNKDPLVIIDGAHNPQSVSSMISNIVLTLDRKKIRFVFGVLRDKDYREIIDLTYLRGDKFYLIKPDSERGLSPYELKEEFDGRNIENEAFDSIEKALKKAIDESNERDVILIFGSFYNGPRSRKYIEGRFNG